MQGGFPGGELVHLGPEPLGGGQGCGVQTFQLPCRRPVAPLGQLLQTSDPMFGQVVQRFSGPLQVLDGRPVFVAGALLGFEIVLDVDERAGLPGALLGLAGGPGPSGDPGGQGLLGMISAQGLQSGGPLLARSPGGDVLAPFQLVPFPLEATEQVLQVGAARQEPVDGGAELLLQLQGRSWELHFHPLCPRGLSGAGGAGRDPAADQVASQFEDEFVKAVIGHSQQAEATDRKLKEKKRS